MSGINSNFSLLSHHYTLVDFINYYPYFRFLSSTVMSEIDIP